jgi:hypothetical protein
MKMLLKVAMVCMLLVCIASEKYLMSGLLIKKNGHEVNKEETFGIIEKDSELKFSSQSTSISVLCSNPRASDTIFSYDKKKKEAQFAFPGYSDTYDYSITKIIKVVTCRPEAQKELSLDEIDDLLVNFSTNMRRLRRSKRKHH